MERSTGGQPAALVVLVTVTAGRGPFSRRPSRKGPASTASRQWGEDRGSGASPPWPDRRPTETSSAEAVQSRRSASPPWPDRRPTRRARRRRSVSTERVIALARSSPHRDEFPAEAVQSRRSVTALGPIVAPPRRARRRRSSLDSSRQAVSGRAPAGSGGPPAGAGNVGDVFGPVSEVVDGEHGPILEHGADRVTEVISGPVVAQRDDVRRVPGNAFVARDHGADTIGRMTIAVREHEASVLEADHAAGRVADDSGRRGRPRLPPVA